LLVHPQQRLELRAMHLDNSSVWRINCLMLFKLLSVWGMEGG